MKCKMCEKHVWSDHQMFHICLDSGEETDMEKDACRSFQFTQRGCHGCPEHENFYDTDAIEGKVKDDRYTRKGKK